MPVPTPEQIDNYEMAPSSITSERDQVHFYDIFIIYLKHGEMHLQQIERIKRSLSHRI